MSETPVQRYAAAERPVGAPEVAGFAEWLFGVASAALLAVLWWRLVYHPLQADFFALFFKPSQILLAAALGICAGRLPPQWAKLVMIGAGSTVIGGIWSGRVLAIYLAQALAVYGAAQLTRTRSARVEAIAIAAALTAGLLLCWGTRIVAYGAISLWIWILFRCISWAVDTRKGCPTTLIDYLTYMLFYPAVFATIEVYEEFHGANLAARPRPDYRAALTRLAMGFVRMSLSVAIPYSFADVVKVDSFFSGWGVVLAVYAKAVLFAAGAFDSAVAIAHLWGYRMREAFPGVFLAVSPREWWRRWRATMTHWLIRYVYIPLGGNQRYRTRNIAIVFGVSTLWHWVGLPFVGARAFYPAFAPVFLWGVINTVVMAIAASLPRGAAATETESLGMRELKWFGTVVFGASSVILLSYGPWNAGQLLDNLRVLSPTSVSWW